jgi:hypothetical protein
LGFVEVVDALQLAFTKNRRLRVWRQKEEKMSPTPVGQLVQLPSFAAEAAKPRHKQLGIHKSDDRSCKLTFQEHRATVRESYQPFRGGPFVATTAAGTFASVSFSIDRFFETSSVDSNTVSLGGAGLGGLGDDMTSVGIPKSNILTF